MLRNYKNALLQEILGAGFDRSLFDGQADHDDDEHPGFRINFGNGRLFFLAQNPNDDFHKFKYRYSSFSPGYPWSDQLPIDYCAFDVLQGAFRRWLADEVRPAVENLAIPDLWKMISAVPTSTGVLALGADSASPFSVEEREQIRLSLQRFRVLIIQNFGPKPDEMAAIEAQLDYLSDAVDRLNRFDWRGVAISTVLGIATTLSLDVERGRLLWGLFQQAFEVLLQLIR